MNDLFIINTEAGVSTCTHPFVESIIIDDNSGGVVSEKIQVTDDAMAKVTDNTFKNVFENGELTFEEVIVQPSAEEVAKEQLKTKLNDGTATLDDIKNALKLLL